MRKIQPPFIGPAGPPGPATLNASPAAFTVTGENVSLETPLSWWRSPWWGNWWQSPWWASTTGSIDFQVDSASYTVTGISVELDAGFTVDAASAAITVTGTAVELDRGYQVNADSAAYTVTGSEVSFDTYNLPADPAAFTVTGEEVSLDRLELNRYSLPIINAPFDLVGSDVSLNKGLVVPSASASYSVTGNAVALEVDAELLASWATVTVTGNAVNLVSSAGYTLPADSASFSVDVSDITLVKGAIDVVFGEYDKTNIIKPEPHGVRVSPEGEGFFFR